MNMIQDLMLESLQLPDRRPIWEWAADNIDFGNAEAYKGPFNIENVPWARGFLEAMQNPRNRQVFITAPPQESGKTKAAEVYLCHRIVNQPARMGFNGVTNTKADSWADVKWVQTRKACKALERKISENRHDLKRRRNIFADGTSLLIQGAELDANRQSDSIEVQVNDECQMWEGTWLSQMHSRTRAFGGVEKIINLGLGGTIGTEWHRGWLSGTQRVWSHHCPHCDKLFQYRFNLKDPQGSNIHFDKTKIQIRTDGTIDVSDFKPTVYVSCHHCKWRIDYDPDLLKRLNLEAMRRGDGWVAMNPNAGPEIESFHVNSFALGRRPWWKIVEPWIAATMGRSVFATTEIKRFIQEELCEFWEERPIIVRKTLNYGDYTRREMRDPKFWSEEWIRLFGMDNQEGERSDIPHRWFVCRAFSRDGRSRLVDCGRINEWADCEKKRIELGVPSFTPDRPGPWTVVDRWHKPQEVDEQCAKFKWFGLLGQDTDDFLHGKYSPNAGERLLFSDERQINLSYGTADGQQNACYFLWARQKVEDVFATLKNGKAESWEIPKDIEEFCPEYLDQINAHHQVMESTKNGDRLVWRGISGAADHLLDCEVMLTVLGLMAGVFKR